jgi:DNA-binding winged helix-turn-helix (wHTH) protein
MQLHWQLRMQNMNRMQLEIYTNRALDEAIQLELMNRLSSAKKISLFEKDKVKHAFLQAAETIGMKDTVVNIETIVNDSLYNIQFLYFFDDSIANSNASVRYILQSQYPGSGRITFTFVLSLIILVLTLGGAVYCHLKIHAKETIQQSGIFSIGLYKYNSKTFRLLHPQGEEMKLTNSQGIILQQLCANIGETVLRETITEALWGKKTDIETRSIDTHVSLLRKLLKDDASVEIRKCYGQGYRLIVG